MYLICPTFLISSCSGRMILRSIMMRKIIRSIEMRRIIKTIIRNIKSIRKIVKIMRRTIIRYDWLHSNHLSTCILHLEIEAPPVCLHPPTFVHHSNSCYHKLSLYAPCSFLNLLEKQVVENTFSPIQFVTSVINAVSL